MQIEIHRNVVLHTQRYPSLGCRLETRQADGNPIDAWLQVGREEEPGCICNCRHRDSGVLILYLDCRALGHRARLVFYCS